MGTLNLGHAGANLIPVGEVDFQLLAELPRQTVTQNLKRNNRVNVRIKDEDLNSLQQKALDNGIPFQSFIAEIVHKFANGDLEEKKA